MAFFAVVLPTIAVTATVIGTAVSVKGQLDAANAAEQTGKYNAKIQRDESVRQTNVAAENARRKERENAGIIGRQRAALAESGMSMEGTPLAILGETSTLLSRDILDIGYDAANKTRSLQASANMSIWEGNTQASAMRTQAVATGFKGIASAASIASGPGGGTPTAAKK
jgi:hypothetical protein